MKKYTYADFTVDSNLYTVRTSSRPKTCYLDKFHYEDLRDSVISAMDKVYIINIKNHQLLGFMVNGIDVIKDLQASDSIIFSDRDIAEFLPIIHATKSEY